MGISPKRVYGLGFMLYALWFELPFKSCVERKSTQEEREDEKEEERERERTRFNNNTPLSQEEARPVKYPCTLHST